MQSRKKQRNKLAAQVEEHVVNKYFMPKGKAGKTGMKHLRRCDMYGQPVELNFNGETTVKSTCGGGVSLIAKFWILMYIVLILIKLFASSSDLNSSIATGYSDISLPVNISSMGFMPYAIVETESEYSREEFAKHVNISFATGNKTHLTYIGAKPCNLEDFISPLEEKTQDYVQLFDTYIGYLDRYKTFCPVVSDYQQAILKGSVDARDFQALSVVARRCDPQNIEGVSCAGYAAQNSYMANLNLKISAI